MNSRAKGCRNERKAADLISKWAKRKFARTPSSGGLNWKSANSKGDIVCTTEGHYFPFCVEIKAHKDINFSELLLPHKKGVKILEFWAQAVRDADKCNKIPMLMMRYNGMPSDLFFMGIPTKFFMQLCNSFPINEVSMITRIKGINITIVPSTQLLSFDYKEIRLLAKKYLKNAKNKKA